MAQALRKLRQIVLNQKLAASFFVVTLLLSMVSFAPRNTIAQQEAEGVVSDVVLPPLDITDDQTDENQDEESDQTEGQKKSLLPDAESNLAVTYNVTIIKYVDGVHATAGNTGSATFNYNFADTDPVFGYEGCIDPGDCPLNSGNGYERVINFNNGANITINEIMDTTVAATCDESKPFALEGYSVGSTELAAKTAGPTAGQDIDIQVGSELFVIIWNDNCSTEEEPDPVPVDNTNLHFIKIVCDDYSDIVGNGIQDDYDDTDGHYTEFSNYSPVAPHFPTPYPAKPVSEAEVASLPDGCHRAAGWNFVLGTDRNVSNPHTVGPTDSNGEINITENDLPDLIKGSLNGGELWVKEQLQPDGPAFAAIRCFKDALNMDNLEVIYDGQFAEDIYCIAYNVGEDEGGGGDNGDDDEYTLNVTIVSDEGASGSVSGTQIDCINNEGDCTGLFNAGDAVNLTAVPGPNSSFDGTWTAGPCSGSHDPVCNFNINANTTVTAHFSVPSNNSSGGNGSRGGNGGSSGDNDDDSDGLVAGDSTTNSLPFQAPGQVLGASTTLPRTGAPVNTLFLVLAAFAAPFVFKRSKFVKES